MQLDKQEIKTAFLTACAHAGLRGDEIADAADAARAALEKRAIFGEALGGAVSGVMKGVPSIADAALRYGFTYPMLAAAGGGLALGHIAANASAPQTTIEEAQKQEVVNTYKQYADYIKQRAAISAMSEKKAPRSPSFR